jgi:hypothetical protein
LQIPETRSTPFGRKEGGRISHAKQKRRAATRSPAALAHRLEVIQIPASNLQLIVALSRIGNNLNQLTRLAHQGRLVSSLVPLLEELLALLDGQKDMASGASTGAPS